MAEVFGCCSSYKECSDIGQCIKRHDAEYSGCSYRKNLEAGRNFYSKCKETPKLLVTMKGSSWWTYNASDEQKEIAYTILKKSGISEIPVIDGPCTSRVVMQANGTEFVIYAPGTRLICEAAAEAVSRKIGRVVPTRVEVMAGGKQQAVIVPPIENVKQEPVLELIRPKKYKQISLFEFIGG